MQFGFLYYLLEDVSMKTRQIVIGLTLLLAVACADYKALREEEARLSTMNADHLAQLRKSILTPGDNNDKKIEFIKKYTEIRGRYAEKRKGLTTEDGDLKQRVKLLKKEQKEVNAALKALGFPELVREP